MNGSVTRRRLVRFCVILILVIVGMIGGLRILESTVFYEDDIQVDYVSKTITRNGVAYFPRQDITVIMILGVDRYGVVKESAYYQNEGRCDAVNLVILDHSKEEYTILSLNRDTMVTMPALGLGGKPAGTAYGQLAISHSYGNGMEESSENTRKTISDFLHGITIDHYVTLNLEGICVLNDAVGGVTVEVVDDFSAVDPSITKGELTLNGEQALKFVQNRRDVGDHLNLSRMERQEEYMQGLIKAFRDTYREDAQFVFDLYEQISSYMVTDCSVNVISGLLERCADYSLAEIVTPEGRNIRGEVYYEFYPDEKKLDNLVLRLFYAKKS